MTASANRLRLATRASPLALWQARYVADALARHRPDLKIQLVEVTTRGDRDRATALARLGTVGVFTREVQRAVLDARADLAVHSLKDLPTDSVPGLVLAAVPKRGPSCDALVVGPSLSGQCTDLDALPQRARVGTGSLRRRAQLRHRRPDIELLEIRGNVETRLRKLDAGDYDALVLAEAGLLRLGLEQRVSARLTPPVMFPAVGQGAIGIECREDDTAVREILTEIDDPPTRSCVEAERALLAALRSGCQAPLGVQSRCQAQQVSLAAVVLSPDGRERLEAAESGPASEPQQIGRRVAEALFRLGAEALIEQARQRD